MSNIPEKSLSEAEEKLLQSFPNGDGANEELELGEVQQIASPPKRSEFITQSTEEFEQLITFAEKLNTEVREEYKYTKKGFYGVLLITFNCFMSAFMMFYLYNKIIDDFYTFKFVQNITSDISRLLTIIGVVSWLYMNIIFLKKSPELFKSFSIFKSSHQSFIIQTKRQLSETLELLRTIEPVLAEQEGWSVMRRHQYRMRLSRLDI